MSRVAFIIGHGKNIGESVASLLKSKGYAVAVGSRNPKTEIEKQKGYYPVKVDVSNTDSIISAFASVNKELGAPNVVIYNAAAYVPPLDLSDPLSLPLEHFSSTVAVGTGAYASAQQALAGFRLIKDEKTPRTFIVTGNNLPHAQHDTKWLSLGILKVIEAQLINYFSRAYLKERIGFYFAVYTTPDGSNGGIPDFGKFGASGPLHADVYWELINQPPKGEWDHRFADDGKKLPNNIL